ncbi:hypothetical protein EZV62_014266 [Acer yangbiense]|uniref:FAM50A/XAP5 C-terminal domain-containing protein n=1 Tax=Acer yangbiense TaxID=1000413 RepID=A0A5C7HRK9_9ROSI|nr:hypothetical protein EZV62_014266 [Acer yangbiense]
MENLLYVKDDLIIPHEHGFYELILNKAKGKSGPVMLNSLNFHVVMLGKLSRGIGKKRTSISSPLLDEG